MVSFRKGYAGYASARYHQCRLQKGDPSCLDNPTSKLFGHLLLRAVRAIIMEINSVPKRFFFFLLLFFIHACVNRSVDHSHKNLTFKYRIEYLYFSCNLFTTINKFYFYSRYNSSLYLDEHRTLLDIRYRYQDKLIRFSAYNVYAVVEISLCSVHWV